MLKATSDSEYMLRLLTVSGIIKDHDNFLYKNKVTRKVNLVTFVKFNHLKKYHHVIHRKAFIDINIHTDRGLFVAGNSRQYFLDGLTGSIGIEFSESVFKTPDGHSYNSFYHRHIRVVPACHQRYYYHDCRFLGHWIYGRWILVGNAFQRHTIGHFFIIGKFGQTR